MADDIRFWISPDGKNATITIATGMVTEEDVRRELQAQGIVSGIKWNEIQDALKRAVLTGDIQNNVPAAEAFLPVPLITFGDETLPGSDANIRKILSSLVSVRTVLKDCDKNFESPVSIKAFYAVKGQKICCESISGKALDVYGKEIGAGSKMMQHFVATNNIHIESTPVSVSYIATKNGYVTVDADDRLDIRDPVIASADSMRKCFVFVPLVSNNAELLIKDYASAVTSLPVKNVDAPHDEAAIAGKLNAGTMMTYVIAAGLPPTSGTDATITVFLQAKRSGVEDKTGHIDLHEISPFIEIEVGTVVAEKINAVCGNPGVDVFGRPIPPIPVKDVDFTAGDNIAVENENGKTKYVAQKTGILSLSDHTVSLTETLHIKGNVGPETGNLYSSNSILVDGDIRSGFKVECGKDLVVKGSIENGAIIRCGRGLTVGHGLFGETSDIVVKGNADIRFIQNGCLHVEGNLAVKSFVSDSKIWCNGTVTVKGDGVNSDEKGCVIGGKLVSMKGMDLKSVGSPANVTWLFCGVDPDALEVLKTTKESVAILNKKAIRIQKEIGVDLKQPDALEKLKTMPNRQQLKTLLSSLKEIASQQESLMAKLPQLIKKTYSETPQLCKIVIRKQAFPDLCVRIGDSVSTLKSAIREFTITYDAKKGILFSGQSVPSE